MNPPYYAHNGITLYHGCCCFADIVDVSGKLSRYAQKERHSDGKPIDPVNLDGKRIDPGDALHFLEMCVLLVGHLATKLPDQPSGESNQ